MTLTDNQKYWLSELRSGDFKQGINYLRSIDDKFCCLGVAAEIFGTKPPRPATGEGNYYLYDPEEASSVAPKYVIEALGLRDDLGRPATPSHFNSLVSLNDGHPQHSFAEIADIVEANPEEYFL